jgi:hypothetical protein
MPKPSSLPILCLDFDGVIHQYTSPWIGADKIPDPVTEGFFEWLEQAVEYFRIIVYSTRSSDLSGVEAMRNYIEREWIAADNVGDCPPLEFSHVKPMAFLQIDDRALTFRGDWSEFSPKELRKFKPWNKE